MSTEATTTTTKKARTPEEQLLCAIDRALEEDAGDFGDLSSASTVPAETQGVAVFLAKADGVLSGLHVADLVFARVSPAVSVTWTRKDGDAVTKGTRFGEARGPARALLVAERVALNFMQRASGIASLTRRFVDAVAAAGATTRVLDTRKTAPGLRALDKGAVVHGGGQNHRYALWDMLMVKDNHIAACGGVANAVAAVSAFFAARPELAATPVEVEASSLAEVSLLVSLLQAGACPVTRIMFDNMVKVDAATGAVDTSMLAEAVALVRDASPAVRVETEASGNITLDTVGAVARTGVDFVSAGQLTHSVAALDISMKISLLQ